MFPKVSIIILNWNGRQDTIECLESLKNINYPNYEIIVVDNGSHDGLIAYLKDNYPYIDIIENEENIGFAEGNNVGIKKAFSNQAEYVLLLNNDTIVDPMFLTELIKVAQNYPNAGILGPKICFYGSNKIQTMGGNISLFRGVVVGQDKYKEEINKNNDLKYTEFVSGCSMLIKKEIFEDVGFLDSSYFAYYEDTDLCIRTKNAGYDLICVPSSVIWHKGSQSSKTNKIGLYYGTRNMIIFEKKYATPFQYFIFLNYFIFVKIPFLLGISLIYHRSLLSLKRCLDGIKDGVL